MTASKGIPRRPSSATHSRTKFRCAELCRHLGAELLIDERANLGEAIPRLGGNQAGRQKELLERSPCRVQPGEFALEVAVGVTLQHLGERTRLRRPLVRQHLLDEVVGHAVEMVDVLTEGGEHTVEALRHHDYRSSLPCRLRKHEPALKHLRADIHQVHLLQRREVLETFGLHLHLRPQSGDRALEVLYRRPGETKMGDDAADGSDLLAIEFADDQVFEGDVGLLHANERDAHIPRHPSRVAEELPARLVILSAHGGSPSISSSGLTYPKGVYTQLL